MTKETKKGTKKEETKSNAKEETMDETKQEAEQTANESANRESMGNGNDFSSRHHVLGDLGDQVGRFASQTVGTIRDTIDKALATSRTTVLSIRVSDEANKKLSMLVDAGIFKSRSESAAFLIEEGIKFQDPLFKKITAKLEQIEKLKGDLKDIVSKEFGS